MYAIFAYMGRAGPWGQLLPRSTFTDAYSALVSRLVDLRKQHGLTQVEVARRIGKPQQFVSVYERRIRRLDAIELYAVVKAIGGDPEAFVREIYRSLPEQVQI